MKLRTGPKGRGRVGIVGGLVVAAMLATLLAVHPFAPSAAAPDRVSKKGTLGNGYFFVATDGGIFNFGDSKFKGSTGAMTLNKPIVGAETTPSGEGYWLVASDGGIFTFGDAEFFGSTGDIKLNKPIVDMAVTPTGKGYWLVATDGGVFTFGDAVFYGSEGAAPLVKPIVGMDATASGKGYYMVASDGGIFTHGDAKFLGSEGATKLNKPIVGMATLPDADGYYLVATDGGIFTHGDAKFFGSEGGGPLNQPIVGMDVAASGQGYYLVAGDGGIFSHGAAPFFGSTGNMKLNKPVVGMTVTPNSPLTAPDFVANLRGSAETGAGGDVDGKGLGFFDLSDDQLCFNLNVNDISSSTAAHIHKGPAGVAGPVVIDLGKLDSKGFGEGCVDVDKTLAKAIMDNPTGYYANVHSTEFPDGAVRGQLAGEAGLVITEKSDGTQSVAKIDTEFPSAVSPLFDITGLAAGEKLAGIDVRPKDGQVYGLLVKGTTGQLVKEGAGTGVDRIGVTFPVTGTAFGFEFNPATDRIRVVSDTEENFQLHPGTGVKTANTDLTPAGTVVGAAHTNNREPAPTTSTLFDIDVAGSGDKVMMQGGPEGSPSADGGVLTTVGPTGFDSGNSLGFDIGFSAAGEPGTAIAAFQTAAATAGSLSEVWAVNVNNATTGNTLGKAVKLGTIGDGTLKVVAFALL